MTTPPPIRHAMIRRHADLLEGRHESSLTMWASMATVLGEIIGDAGYDALFFRCLCDIEPVYPWLAEHQQRKTGALAFLTVLMADRQLEEKHLFSVALLIIFTDTLNLLIGELVTNRILLTAWGMLATDAPEPSK